MFSTNVLHKHDSITLYVVVNMFNNLASSTEHAALSKLFCVYIFDVWGY